MNLMDARPQLEKERKKYSHRHYISCYISHKGAPGKKWASCKKLD